MRWSALALLAGSGTACGPRAAPSADAAAPQPPSSEASYLAPPDVTVVAPIRGGLEVSGVAPPRSTVEIMSPEGEQARAVADRRGGWSARLSATPQPRLYAISATLAGRIVHAEGALVTAPGTATPAVTVRAGYAALPLGRGGPTDIATVDYDPSGFIAVAGSARVHGQLLLMVDGTAAAVGQADSGGRYALLAANRRLPMGPHRLQVRAPDGVAVREVMLQTPGALTAPYQAWPAPDGWRVEWALNGGGVQTTLILNR